MMNKNAHGALYLAGFFLIAANLRGAITCVGPLIPTLRATLGLTATGAGALNTLPLLAFAAFSPLALFGRRFGIERTLLAGLACVALGTLARSLDGVATLFAGTLLLSAGIGLGNVLLPSLIKRDFPLHVPNMTTAYSVAFGLAASIASGVAVPLTLVLPGGWRGAMGCWALLAVIGLLVWLPTARAARPDPPAAPDSPEPPRRPVWRSPLAWQVTGFMGLQSLGFYVSIGWFPSYLQDRGFPPSSGGWLLMLLQVVSLGVGFLIPPLVRRARDQRWLAFGGASLMALATVGLLWTPRAAVLWFALLGAGSGASIILALMFLGLRANNHAEAAALSTMAQSVGYLIAAAGPFAFGAAHDLTGSWDAPFFALGGLALTQAVLGYRAGQARTP